MITERNTNPDTVRGMAHTPFWLRLTTMSPGRLAWVWLLAGFLLLPFTAWQNVVPLAAWLAPVFLLRFARTSPRPRLVIPLIILAYTAAILFDWRNGPMDTLSIAFGLSMSLARGLFYALPYLADRRIGARLGSWGRLLLFPLAFTSVDWVMGLVKPITTHGSPAYSQYPILPLIQIISISGMWGLTFLIAWFASTANACWEASLRWPAVRGKLALFAGVLAAVYIYGAVRLSQTHGQAASTAQTITVATVTNETIFDPLNSMDLATFNQSDEAERAAVWPQFQAVNDRTFQRIESALQAGALIVVTQETGGLALEEDKERVLARATPLSQQYHAYLAISLWVFSRRQTLPYIYNQTFLIDPAGQLVWIYEKTNPVFGGENFLVFSGSGRLPVVDTPYGRMSTAICNDLNFPALLRQAGRKDVDILIAPFNDDPAISTQNPAEAAYRTIENGVSTIRAAGRGTSMVIDPQGRALASQDYFTTSSHVMLAILPLQRASTIYSRIGDLFAYLCVAGTLLLVGLALLHRR